MSSIQQELEACRKSAEFGYSLAEESFSAMKDALKEEKRKLKEADRQQNQISRLRNDAHFQNQLREMRTIERDTVDRVKENLDKLQLTMQNFTIVLYGRTMAGKSTLMEILRHGDGSTIGKGSQRTTRDVRGYEWEGLKIFDVPGTCSFGGQVDDKTALEAAKSADLALFLLTDDAPQPEEADRLAELKSLGKPVLGIVNVKQALSDKSSAKRKIDVKQIQKKIGDSTRLKEIVLQFKEFAKKGNSTNFKGGYNFDDVPFVYSHLQSAFFSQQENDPSLYELSNFKAVENFILDKVREDGKFIRIKTFIDAVARPMQHSIATLYGHSSETVKAWQSYSDKIDQLDAWRSGFVQSVQNRYDNFIEGLTDDINGKLNYVVDNYYESNKAGDAWKEELEKLNISRRCQNFIQDIGEDATWKLRELSDELTQDLRYAGVSVDAEISMPEIDDTQSALMLAAPLLALTPVGWIGAAAFGLFTLIFGESKETKIRKAKDKLREELNKSRQELLGMTTDNVLEVLNKEILNKQIGGFRDTLIDMLNMFKPLAYSQNNVATAINNQYKDLNFELFIRAAFYLKSNPEEFQKLTVVRIVGEEMIVINAAEVSEETERKLSKILGEKVTCYKVDGENYKFGVLDCLHYHVLNLEPGDTNVEIFVEDEENGDMLLLYLPGNIYFTPSQIQFAQQLVSQTIAFY